MNQKLLAVKDAITPVLESMQIELVDIEMDKKYGEDNLTIYIFHKDGTTLEVCEKAHLAIDPVLDQLDPTNGNPYVLNVSSPGLDRPFKTQRDFDRNTGTEVEVKLYAPLKGKKVYEGTLIAHDTGTTTISIAGENAKIENTRIALVRPLVKFS